jgi:hypothetical protein
MRPQISHGEAMRRDDICIYVSRANRRAQAEVHGRLMARVEARVPRHWSDPAEQYSLTSDRQTGQ